jgi:hypothetical protein
LSKGNLMRSLFMTRFWMSNLLRVCLARSTTLRTVSRNSLQSIFRSVMTVETPRNSL